MDERQKHGFEYEELKINENNLIKEENYTAKWDTFEIYNDVKTPVSVKCIGLNSSIDFGDFKRQTEVDEDFILYVGFWKGKKNNIVEEYKVLINKDVWNSYFGDKSIIQSMLDEMKGISNDYSDDNKWKDYRNKYKELYGKSIISLRFKRDHKKQKRIQCGITKPNFVNVVLKDNVIISKKLKNS
jgi:hypothetical protein